MQSFVSGVFNKFPLMSKFYRKSCGHFCCTSRSPNHAIKTVNGAFRILVFQRMFCSRQLQTYCKLKPLGTVKKTRISSCWTFYGLRLNIIAPRQRSCYRGFSRNFSSFHNSYQQKNKTTAIYIIALVTVVLGGSYAAVPLYRIFCQVRNDFRGYRIISHQWFESEVSAVQRFVQHWAYIRASIFSTVHIPAIDCQNSAFKAKLVCILKIFNIIIPSSLSRRPL